MAWTTITDAVLAVGKFARSALIKQFRDNDSANADKPYYIPLIETRIGVGTSYPGTAHATYHGVLPTDAKILDVRSALWGSGATTYSCKMIMKYSGASVTVEQSSTATAKGSVGGTADKTWSFTGLDDVGGTDFRGVPFTLEIYFKVNSGTGNCNIDSTGNWIASRTREA